MSDAAPQGRSLGPVIKAIAQILGFVLGLGLFAWCVHIALKPGNREQLTKLIDAPLQDKLALLGLSVVVVIISSAIFQLTLRPVKKLKFLDVQATGVIACLLALLPFKLSVVFRVVVHNRRDGVPLLTIGAWFASVAAVLLAVVGPVLLVSMWRHTPDAIWLSCTLGGVLLCSGALLIASRIFLSERGWRWLMGVWGGLPLPNSLRTPALQERVHEGVRMLASPSAVLSCVGLRLMDMLVQAARFKIAAAIVGQPLGWDQAVLAGATFFLIGAVAPSGQVGAREAGTAGLLNAVLPSIDFQSFTIVVLLVSATETLVLLVGSMMGLAWLRPDRLLRLGHKKGA